MATITVTPIGTTQGHAGQAPTNVDSIVLHAGGLRAEVWTYGATLTAMMVPGHDGEVDNVVHRRGALRDYDQPDRGGYPGATIGRYANRIACGRFELDGQMQQVSCNEGANHLHGGMLGFDQYVWDHEVDSGASDATLTLRHRSGAGDQGFPGTLDVTVRYRLDSSSLTLEYEASTDAPTIVNCTNHAYWNLAGSGSIVDHEVAVGASSLVQVDDELLPTGELVPVVDTRFDLRTPTRLGEVLAGGGLDHCFVLDGPGPAAVLTDPGSGRTMTVTTDQIGLQLYSAEHFAPPRTGLCLETQALPDTPNHPACFGSAVLRPGDTYRHGTTHEFGLLPDPHRPLTSAS